MEELVKERDKFDVKYETSRFENMISFGDEFAFDVMQQEKHEIAYKNAEYNERKFCFTLLWNLTFLNFLNFRQKTGRRIKEAGRGSERIKTFR